MSEFYILSLKHSPYGNSAVWWGPNDCGYTSDLDHAGVYSEKSIKEKPGYYNNGESTVAVLCSAARHISHREVKWDLAKQLSEGRNE